MLSLSKHGIALIAALTTGPLTNYAATPQQAAQNVVHAPDARAIRTNIVGRYAVVETRGGVIEGSAPPKLMLLEHFSFGWQAVDFVQDQCALAPRGISPQTAKALLHRMPEFHYEPRGCNGAFAADSGPPADITAIRHDDDTLLIPNVSISGSYAISGWFGDGGGQHLYKKSGRTWRLIAGGGGEMDVQLLRDKGVPPHDACALPVQHNVVCPK